MIINLNHLSEDKLNLIPFSIRIHAIKNNDSLIDLDLLPYDVVHELLGSIESEVNQAPVVEKTTIDLRPVLSVYNDFTTIETKKDAIIEYIKNYFTVNLGDYPFDPTFGTRLKEYLNTLDTPTQQLLISNEVSGLVKSLSKSFYLPVEIRDLTITSANLSVHSEVNINMTVVITDQSITNSFKVVLTQFVS